MDEARSPMMLRIATIVVFVIAVLLRLPSCGESFWVDELHSAWAVWGSFGEVFPRAGMGNQTPFYFAGLWVWKQVFGGSEVALRMTSVLATGAAAAVLTSGIARWTRSTVAGVGSGLILAVESNAIFFGTELRPYAFVVLAASIAVLCFLRLISQRPGEAGELPWIGLVLSTLLAALCQPTSLTVLGWLFVLLAIRRIVSRQMVPRFGITNLLLATAAIAVVWALWSSLQPTWQSRGRWASFARAPDWSDAAGMWEWLWLWLIPVVLILVPGAQSGNAQSGSAQSGNAQPSSAKPGSDTNRQRVAILSVAACCVLASAGCWLASRMDWVHLWHRRYVIALLPMFAAVAGAAIGRFQMPNRRLPFLPIAVALTLITGLTWSQGVIQILADGSSRLVYRGEDWRGAVRWLAGNTTTSDRVFIDSGLIESRGFRLYAHEYEPRSYYLRYPILGPYQVGMVRPFNASDGIDPLFRYLSATRQHRTFSWKVFPERENRIYLLLRQKANTIDLRKLLQSTSVKEDDVSIHGFGGVSVVVIDQLPRGIADGL